MRVIELSNHPDAMLRGIYLERRAVAERARSQRDRALARHRRHVGNLRDQRARARGRSRWLTWLRLSLAVWRQQRKVPRRPVVAPAGTAGGTAAGTADRVDKVKAGMAGEQAVATELGAGLGDDWTLLRGYRNHRGEIDHVLLGPRGLLAIEVKHRNATVHVNGDEWRFEKYDRYGNLVEQGLMTERGGRSPSVQLNEPASELERFLRSRGQQVAVTRVVVLTHRRSRLGTTKNLTVHIVATSTGYLLSRIKAAPAVFDSRQLARLEQLIVRDHQHHEARRPR